MCKHSDVFSRPVLIVRGLDIRTPITTMQLSGYAGTGMLWHMAARLWLRTVRNERGIAPRGPHPQLNRVSGDYAGGETPLPIPNRAVKPAEADGTWGETPWESRKSPGLFEKPPREGRFSLHIVTRQLEFFRVLNRYLIFATFGLWG